MIQAVHAEIARAGLVAPVRIGSLDERAFLDCDLASMAENRLGDRADPRGIDAQKRADWRGRATSERVYPLASRSKYERCYWLLEEGERVGTIALGTSTMGSPFARVSSFYVFPTHRKRGVGRRALERLEKVLAEHKLGIRLETSWSWQRTVRFYLKAGLWVYSWKRDLSLSWHDDLPAPRFEIGEREASMFLPHAEGEILLARARKGALGLELDERPKDERVGEAYWSALSTFSLALALEGFPLVRSPEMYEKCHYADAGAPEALAYKIQIWEAWDRHHGWVVETPRIPGLQYPTWVDLEAKWAQESEEIEAKMKRGELP